MTPTQVALRDIEYHRKHGSDLNPFSTPMLRDLWQLGFDGHPLPERYVNGSYYADAHVRGQLTAQLMNIPTESPT